MADREGTVFAWRSKIYFLTIQIDLMNRVKEGMKIMAANLAPQDDPNNFMQVNEFCLLIGIDFFSKVAPEQNLLRWFNFHLRHAGWSRQVTNFGADIRDSEAYILLFTQVAPHCSDRCV